MLKFKVPIYNVDIVFIVTKDILLEGRKHKLEFDLDINDSKGICFNSTIQKKIYIFIKEKHLKWSTITHECLHATNYILSSRGVEVTTENDEAQAYLLGYIVGKVQEYLV
jgi:hypothetical protein